MGKKAWGSEDSLEQYFPEHKISEDEVAIQKFIIDFLKRRNFGRVDRMLDFGAGPTVHRLVLFVPYAKHIDVAEYLPESLRAIRNWINGKKGSRNWNVYIRKTLELEGGKIGKNAVTKRRTLLKKKIERLLRGDIRKSDPLGKKIQYPLVTSFYCADAITTSKQAWRIYMHNLSSLVASGGWLFITVSRDTDYSMLGEHRMPNVKLREPDIKAIFTETGYDMQTFKMKRISAKMWSYVGISSVLVACAQKQKAK